jgi:hypothetical protein
MKSQQKALIFAAMTLFCAVPLVPQQTREEAIKGMRKVSPSEMDPTYTQAPAFAQRLVNAALDKHPEVILLAIHAQPPGHSNNLIVASNFGRIGKIGDEDDMRCIHTGKPNLEVAGPHFEAELPLKDAAGQTIGALGVVFNYKPGDDKQPLVRIAEQIGREMQSQLPDGSRLFGPAS